MSTSRLSPYLFPLALAAMLSSLMLLQPKVDARATVRVEVSNSPEELDRDGDATDTGLVDQKEDLGNDPMFTQHLDTNAVPLDSEAFALEGTDTDLVALFVPLTDTGAGPEFFPEGIDEDWLPDPPTRFDTFKVDYE